MSLREAGVALIDCVHKTPAAVSDGLPYVGIPQMKNGHVTFDGARRISEANFVEWTKKAKPRLHDVVLSRRTNPGVTAVFTDCRFALGQNLVLLRADGTVVLPEFLRWLVSGPEWWTQIDKYINVGAVFDSLRCADVPMFQLSIPPKPEQKSIASLLSALDNKIQLNRQMNETLEAMAQAIFKDWFVDFGPTRAKMEGRAPYLAPDIWALFPDTFDAENKPAGWVETTLKQHGQVVTGKTPGTQNADYYGYDMPFLKIPDMHGKIYVLKTSSSLSKKGARSQMNKTLPPGSVSVSCIATPGLVIINHQHVQTNQQINSVIPESKDESLFVFWSCRQLAADIMRGGSGGSVFHNMNKTSFENLKIMFPGNTASQVFSNTVEPLHDRILTNERESSTLAATRDLLLPKLMSGEIRMRDAEAMNADAE